MRMCWQKVSALCCTVAGAGHSATVAHILLANTLHLHQLLQNKDLTMVSQRMPLSLSTS